jgi:hypothetical protein
MSPHLAPREAEVDMKFPLLLRMSLLLGVFVPTTAFGVNPEPDLAITVLVFNFKQVQGTILAKAEGESGRILAHAGVHVTWRDCPTGNEPCLKGQGRVFFLAIKAGPVQNEFLDTVSGYALLQDHLAVVHYDYLPRIPRGKRGINETAMVLGCVITHELGHLLLGEREHSIAGIMQAYWGVAQIQSALESHLSFLPEEAVLMHADTPLGDADSTSALGLTAH